MFAALPCSSIVGSSGTLARNLSNCFLKTRTETEETFLRYAGSILKRDAPLTARLESLALFTFGGADLGVGVTIQSLPRLPPSVDLID